jgi:hypothetical protein
VVVCVKRCSLSARRALGYGNKTVPCSTLRIFSANLRVNHTTVYTGFVETFAGLVPFKFEHIVVLLLVI